ncbi:DUF3891 family protein [Alkalicoccus chagannorensis]|uniref:DUF3891 family protein n=1 Tax=Alkalicoccus chagannorensis TaxID=427072 RepID=UPI000400331A|nr:DUF3891 family protein [Alkalicoccus chagannorensis]
MIIFERNDAFYMTEQEHHAEISGDLAHHWLAESDPLSPEAVQACRLHDRAWREPDAAPRWNDRADAPESFLHYPVVPKMIHYSYGIDEVERTSAYAAYLNSLHYTSLTGSDSEAESGFQEKERLRRQRLYPEAPEQAARDLLVMQFTDSLSLFFFMHPHGSTYKNSSHGLTDSTDHAFAENRDITGSWTSADSFELDPTPFHHPFTTELIWRKVLKSDAYERGLTAAFHDAERIRKTIRIS